MTACHTHFKHPFVRIQTGYTYDIEEQYGEDNVYLVSDYKNPFDNYQGQDVVIFDEFRGQFRLAETLMYLQGYKQEIRARYSNKVALWTKVYITSPVTPYEVYKRDNDTNGSNDKLQQLYRRINNILYCFKLSDLDHTYYCQQRFECELDNYPERIYQQFYEVRKHYYDELFIRAREPKSKVGFEVTKVDKAEDEKRQDLLHLLMNNEGIPF